MTNEEAISVLIGTRPCTETLENPSPILVDIDRATDIAIKCIEKQIPKETIEDGYNGGACACPNCGWAFAFNKESKAEIIKMDMYRYCPECGQAIDWSDVCD